MQIKKVILTLVTILLVVTSYKPTFALDDGAYLIGRSTSYVNPLTGQTEIPPVSHKSKRFSLPQ